MQRAYVTGSMERVELVSLNFWDPMRLGTPGPQYNYDIGAPSIKMENPLVRVHDNNIAG